MTIAKAIQEARKKRKMTQSDLAKEVDLSRTYISDIERSRYQPSFNTMIKLAKVLDLDLNYLIKNDGNTIQR